MEIPDYLTNFLMACNVCKRKMGVLRGLSVMAVLLFAASLSASTITISSSGTFSKNTGSSTFSGPNETWAFSFVVASSPAVSNVDLGNYFDVAFSDFSYSLDDSAVAITPVDIRFFSTAQFSGFNICFTTACSFFNSPTDGFDIEGTGTQMYTGHESAPTMSTGTFTANFLDIYVNSDEYKQLPHPTLRAVANLATPEPSTIATLSAGLLLALAGRRFRRRK
jgi:hypothetical protein